MDRAGFGFFLWGWWVVWRREEVWVLENNGLGKCEVWMREEA
jgi:hypothetical protein